MNFLKSFAIQQQADQERQRKFTPHELTEGITTGQYNAMPADEQREFDKQLLNFWTVGHPDENYRAIEKAYREDRRDEEESGYWS